MLVEPAPSLATTRRPSRTTRYGQHVIGRDRYHVYVDEAGDRGSKSTSSPVFILSAIIVHADADRSVRDALEKINGQLGRAPDRAIHWRDDLGHPERKMAASTLGAVDAHFINIVVCKLSYDEARTHFISDPIAQYNFCVHLLLERVSWLMERQRPRGVAKIHLAHVRRFKYDRLHSYLEDLQKQKTRIAWEALSLPPKIEAAQAIRGLQAADILAGSVYAAVRTDPHGEYEPEYLRRVAPRLWTGPTGKLETYGLKFLGRPGCTEPFTWLAEIKAIACGTPSGPL